MDTLSCFSALFTKGDNFFDFLFASPADFLFASLALRKWGLLLKERNLLLEEQIPSLKSGPPFRRGQNRKL